ncbi:MAG: acylphosphatase [Patescibacteria group bacterium]
MKRVHLIISGDVQGVNYRSWARAQARELNLSGWITNRPDGAVETVVEGQKKKLEEYIKRCHKGPEVAWVEKVDTVWLEATGELVNFSVVY